MSLSFGANSTDRLDISQASSINLFSVFTYIVWVNTSTITINRTILSRRTTSGGTVQVEFTNGSGDITLRVRRVTSAAVYSSNNTPISTNAWKFIACTWDINASASNLGHIYIGDLSTIATEVTYGSQSDGSGAADTQNGNFFVGNNNAQTTVYQGKIAFLGVWNRVLTLGEVIDQQFHRHVTSGCVEFMELGFNGTGTQPDWSGNGNPSIALTGATVSAHVPLGPLFGFDAIQGFAAAATVAGHPARRRLNMTNLLPRSFGSDLRIF